MKRIMTLSIAALLAAAVLFTACKPAGETKDSTSGTSSVVSAAEGGAPNEEESAFGHFTSEDLEGNAVDQTLFADHELTMFNIWATDCPPCIGEMPELAELNKEYADKGVQVVGIVMDLLGSDSKISEDQLSLAKDIVKQTGADYLHLRPSEDLIAIALQYVTATPATVFIDKDGNYVGQAYYGARNKEKWSKIVDEKLEEVSK